MAYQNIKNVEITGLAACVPVQSEENSDLDIFETDKEFQKFVEHTGIERRRKTRPGFCASDLCFHAAERLLSDLNWQKEDIECLVFVSHSPDYKYPATACILQARLGLSNECMSFDISLGCSGWVYGLSTIASLISASKFQKALLLVGDTTTTTKSPKDKSTYPLFGDAGSATALTYNESADDIYAHMATDGGNYKAIIMEDGGFRNPFTIDSLKETLREDGSIRSRLHTHMDGMTVFSFGINKVPKSVHKFFERFEIEKSEIDYFVFHQANKMMNQKIQKKLQIPDEKAPHLFKNYGNTSSSSIPLTMVTNLKDQINASDRHKINLFTCGFGVGLSWGSVYFRLQNAICSELIEV